MSDVMKAGTSMQIEPMYKFDGFKARAEFLKAMNKVQGTIEPTKTDSLNPHFKSKYASLGAVNATVMGPLTENGFVLLSGGCEISGKPYLKTVLYHKEGHCETFHYPLIENTSNPQHLAASITYARRYSICALLNLSVEDDDGNTATEAAPKMSAAVEKVFTPSGDVEQAQFIPSRVVFVPGKGKGAGKTFSEIYSPTSDKFGGDELQGEIAESAKNNRQEIKIAYKRVGNYLNIIRNGVSVVKPEESQEVIENAPF